MPPPPLSDYCGLHKVLHGSHVLTPHFIAAPLGPSAEVQYRSIGWTHLGALRVVHPIKAAATHCQSPAGTAPSDQLPCKLHLRDNKELRGVDLWRLYDGFVI